MTFHDLMTFSRALIILLLRTVLILKQFFNTVFISFKCATYKLLTLHEGQLSSIEADSLPGNEVFLKMISTSSSVLLLRQGFTFCVSAWVCEPLMPHRKGVHPNTGCVFNVCNYMENTLHLRCVTYVVANFVFV